MTLEFKLDKYQTKAFELAKPGRICTFSFGRGAGKSFLGRALIHVLALRNPGAKIGLLMPSLKMARSVFWPALMDDYTGGLAKHVERPNRTELWCNYSNGSRLSTWGAENADSIRGQRFDVLIEDEADDIHPDVEQAIVRPTFSRAGVNAIWVKFGTPRRGRYGGLYRDYMHAQEDLELPEEQRRYVGFKVRSSDSPQVDQVWLAGVKASTPPTIYAREYDVDFDSGEGLVYSMFEEDFHVRAPHPETVWSEVLVGMDYGWEDPGALILVGVQGYGKDVTCHVIDEIYEQHRSESWWCDRVIDVATAYPDAKWYHDPSRPDRIASYQTNCGITVRKTENSIEMGVSCVAEAMMIHRDRDAPYARLYVSPKCVSTVRELCTYRRKRDPRDRERVLEEIEDKNNHLTDSLRYALCSRFGLTRSFGRNDAHHENR